MKEHLGVSSPRRAALVNPFETAIVFWLLVVSVMFTFWPQALEHSPISFEDRGVIHHVWHYTLLAGSISATFGLLSKSPWRAWFEIFGLILLAAAVALNLIAVISAGLALPPLAGWGVTLRIAILTGLVLRVYVLTTEPLVVVPVQTFEGEK